MHVGLALTFQNLISGQSDAEVYRHELTLATRAEESGFDSVWTPEHHFTDYMLTPNVTQFLSWVAGQTRHVKLGTMVTVLPWHEPLRVAESFTLLDHLSGGRAILGIGRGLGRVEFNAFRLNMNESRKRFVEYASALLKGLESGVMEYDGDYYKQPKAKIRPAPYATFKGRAFASAISPESIDIMSRLGVGLLIVAQKPWEMVKSDVEAYRNRFREINGEEAPRPIMNVFVAVNEDPVEAQRMRETYLESYARSTVMHYEFDNADFAKIEGYEYYSALAKNIAKHGLKKFNSFLADLQVWGTPQQVIEKLKANTDFLGLGGMLIALSYGGMPPAVARANYDLFAKDVLPALKAHDVGGDIGVRYEPTAELASIA